jgi:hypothetical protein
MHIKVHKLIELKNVIVIIIQNFNLTLKGWLIYMQKLGGKKNLLLVQHTWISLQEIPRSLNELITNKSTFPSSHHNNKGVSSKHLLFNITKLLRSNLLHRGFQHIPKQRSNILLKT